MLASLALGVALVTYMRACERAQHPVRTSSAIRFWKHLYFNGNDGRAVVAGTVTDDAVESPSGVAIHIDETGVVNADTNDNVIGFCSGVDDDDDDDDDDEEIDDNTADEKTRMLLSNRTADSFTIETHTGRPDFDAVIRRFAQDSALVSSTSSATCFVSGPESFNAAVRDACSRTNTSFRCSSKSSRRSYRPLASHVVFHPVSFEF